MSLPGPRPGAPAVPAVPRPAPEIYGICRSDRYSGAAAARGAGGSRAAASRAAPRRPVRSRAVTRGHLREQRRPGSRRRAPVRPPGNLAEPGSPCIL